MELEDGFTVNSPMLSHILEKRQLVSAHILPNGQGRWLIGSRLVNLAIFSRATLASTVKNSLSA